VNMWGVLVLWFWGPLLVVAPWTLWRNRKVLRWMGGQRSVFWVTRRLHRNHWWAWWKKGWFSQDLKGALCTALMVIGLIRLPLEMMGMSLGRAQEGSGLWAVGLSAGLMGLALQEMVVVTAIRVVAVHYHSWQTSHPAEVASCMEEDRLDRERRDIQKLARRMDQTLPRGAPPVVRRRL
jgi:hypothetical protein